MRSKTDFSAQKTGFFEQKLIFQVKNLLFPQKIYFRWVKNGIIRWKMKKKRFLKELCGKLEKTGKIFDKKKGTDLEMDEDVCGKHDETTFSGGKFEILERFHSEKWHFFELENGVLSGISHF